MSDAGHTLTHKAAPCQDNPTSTVSSWWLISGGDKPSLWCQELLCPPWAWGRGSSGSPQHPPCLVPPKEPSLFWLHSSFRCSVAGMALWGWGQLSSISSALLGKCFIGVSPRVLLIAGWALGQDSDVQVPISQGCVVLLVAAHAIDYPAGNQPWGAAH